MHYQHQITPINSIPTQQSKTIYPSLLFYHFFGNLGVIVVAGALMESCYIQAILQLQLMMSAYSVMDSVNKYRHGVLIGNFVQDKFGKDLHQKGPNPDAPKVTTSKLHHDLGHSLYQSNQFIASQQPNQSQFYETGRSLQGQPYKRPQGETTYNIFHRQEVNKQVPLVQNNPKRQARLESESKLYDQTRYNLANKFSRGDVHDPTLEALSEEIPDILTGEIYKSKPSIGSEVKLDQKGKPKIQSNINTKSVNPYSTYSIVKPEIQRFQQVQYNKFVYPHHKGQKRDVLFGHGLGLQDFQRRQLATTYDLSYNQKVMPQTQVNSFYQPENQLSAKEFHRQTFYEKNHQPRIPSVGDTKILGQQKLGRPYEPYTGTFDYNHLKNEYLRK